MQVERKNKKRDSIFNKMYEAQVLSEKEGGHYGVHSSHHGHPVRIDALTVSVQVQFG